MGGLVRRGLIRGWGMCNDNCYGLTASAYTARAKVCCRPNCYGASRGESQHAVLAVSVEIYSLTRSLIARVKGVAPPCTMQNDYSVLNRRIEENGQAAHLNRTI